MSVSEKPQAPEKIAGNGPDDANGPEEQHARRMSRKKDFVEKAIAAAREERGILLVNTGNGKGKSSAAFGIIARALGQGMKAAIVQFVKGRADTGEAAFFRDVQKTLPDKLFWHITGEGYTWKIQDTSREAAAARGAWDLARGYLSNPGFGLVVLDEMTYAFKFRWLDLSEVLEAIGRRPPMQHVVITGRAAPRDLIAAADTVTDMVSVKHAFQAGVKAMPGIDW
ncbi:MAG: cob(I)yrinic acid a,c-diamide adenosyltransferase [Candidatus Accumulibacter sp.]|jgi:cob(I)alamin adenosyltransferase|nr:cob(I)yrinic acid a,c-diamide adenosyltransferase [Accumulibacter sp.]